MAFTDTTVSYGRSFSVITDTGIKSFNFVFIVVIYPLGELPLLDIGKLLTVPRPKLQCH